MSRESGEFLAHFMVAFLALNAIYLLIGFGRMLWDSLKKK